MCECLPRAGYGPDWVHVMCLPHAGYGPDWVHVMCLPGTLPHY